MMLFIVFIKMDYKQKFIDAIDNNPGLQYQFLEHFYGIDDLEMMDYIILRYEIVVDENRDIFVTYEDEIDFYFEIIDSNYVNLKRWMVGHINNRFRNIHFFGTLFQYFDVNKIEKIINSFEFDYTNMNRVIYESLLKNREITFDDFKKIELKLPEINKQNNRFMTPMLRDLYKMAFFNQEIAIYLFDKYIAPDYNIFFTIIITSKYITIPIKLIKHLLNKFDKDYIFREIIDTHYGWRGCVEYNGDEETKMIVPQLVISTLKEYPTFVKELLPVYFDVINYRTKLFILIDELEQTLQHEPMFDSNIFEVELQEYILYKN